MIHEILSVGMLDCNCSILGDESTGEAVVIDPGGDVEKVQRLLDRHHLQVKYIVATHAHIDHVGGVEPLKQASGAELLMHESDLALYQGIATQAEWLGVPAPAITKVDRVLREGDTVRCGALTLKVLHTPGHSPGSISLYLDGDRPKVFSGDTLFQGSIGRTDLWEGSPEDILRSIKTRLMILPDDTQVFPGHGAPTTIGEERRSNPYLQQL